VSTVGAAPKQPASVLSRTCSTAVAAHSSPRAGGLNDAVALTALGFPLAAFDCLLAAIAGYVLQQMTPQQELSDFLDEAERYVQSMSTTVEAKASAVGRGLEWTLQSYSPEVIALQEFNSTWLEQEAFKSFWDSQIATPDTARGFRVMQPPQPKNPFQQMLLLIRNDGRFEVDERLTDLTTKYMASPEFAERLRPAFTQIYPSDLVEPQLAQLLGETLPYKVAVGMCRLRRSACVAPHSSPQEEEEFALLIGAHAASDGTKIHGVALSALSMTENVCKSVTW
jgi:hypothetical protein